MVIFNELRICEDGNYMIVDVEIDDAVVYSSMYIKDIYIDYYKNVSASTMPSSKAIKVYDNTEDDSEIRSRRITVYSSQLSDLGLSSFEGGLFYVIVNCDGTLPASISSYPCGADSTVKIGVALDWKKVYQRGMSLIASLLDKCGNPCPSTSAFEHFILLWNALKLAIAACDWDAVSDLWDKFLLAPNKSWISSSTVPATISSGCGCH